MSNKIAVNVIKNRKKYFTELPSLKVLSRPSHERSEVTVYGNFFEYVYIFVYLCINIDGGEESYSWPSGNSNSNIPIPIASVGSSAYLLLKNFKQLKNFKLPTPTSIAGAIALDIGLHATRLAYQFNIATKESHERAEMLAWRLLDLRRKHDYLRVVGHSLGCRHIVEACSLMNFEERPDSIHLCAPALVARDIVDHIKKGTTHGLLLGQKKTLIYYSKKDITLGILLRTLLMGEQAIGEIGLPEQIGFVQDWLDPSVRSMDVSKSLGGFYIGAHTDYANKFHYFAQPF
ncbi:uncharacterized protein BX663DRAFT_514251 [Cokeromyces recurvatus]|uniref:uncharacterized protein n=1 Tax=Cokeromyces recurvatus TaxID=90255 RepID=UPI00221E4253|nr:uncharacterized protein BX663DRAFT_514251 [Cokeromyces recurvatus]KAI7901374.1 hypothetical protein BX663DRAFT_514251 [Cokeromyces recurvatus]